jgi:peptidylprolyl isomerase
VTRFHRGAAVLALALAVTACGSAEEKKEAATLQDQIKVSGEFGAKPTLEIDAPLKVPESTSWSEQVGTGEKVGADATTILQLTLANGRTGETAVSTYDEGQRPFEAMLGDQIFPSLVEALTDKPAHSRVVVASTADDAYGDQGAPQIEIKGGDPVVMVADVLSTDPTSVLDGPTGATPAPPGSAPAVLEEDGLPVGFDFAGARKPRKLQVITLREGTGPAVETPDRIAADYFGAVWGEKASFDETFTKEPANFSIGMSSVIKGWDTALAGKKEGARVLVICPPQLAYGATAQPNIPANSTLVFVVDILGVG